MGVEVSSDRSTRGTGPGAGGSSRTGAIGATGAAQMVGPGKQTLTSLLDAAMVQQRAAGGATPTDVHAAAAHGTSGSATTLPHLAPIQQSFGRHSVGHVQAHVGGSAAEGAAAMGASAFAVGDRVAFAGAPDLHTAAHEAAHVVQQRGGVQLRGGVGEVGDPHERHADAVADLVVQGKSSEALLDQYGQSAAARRIGASGGAVQRFAFINSKQVMKTDSFVTGDLVDFVTDDVVRDYFTVDEFRNHVAGKTDYLGTIHDDINMWVRFSPTDLNVLGEAHETPWSLKHVLAAVGSKNFISEAIASEDPAAGSELKASYDAHNADRYKEMGIEQEKDKTQVRRRAAAAQDRLRHGLAAALPEPRQGDQGRATRTSTS